MLFFFCLLISFKITAQNNISNETNPYYKIISFGQKNDFGSFTSTVVWNIRNSKNNSNVTLYGSEINNYVFEEPGEYEINFQDNKKHVGECNHDDFPARFHIKVEPVKIIFDFSKIRFSSKLQANTDYTDLEISVPVTIDTKNNSISKALSPVMSVSGVGASLKAKPVEREIVLTNRNHVFKYRVSGRIDKQTYLMFDFYDLYGQVQTYNHPQLIK
ncbi:hypothetical protein K6T82_05715 [Flavobacterium sp. 17A]|uniref:Uncharacterized protein n=1 Tax=Flavobacterium potami TaxID=2872310 RepID=A0A9X1KPA7_9FLAO|nr:hypothetical protein [Flavobacterium potami]MBZ4034254.1 hypothetical protein [Flavobacterium potami]